MAYLDDPTTQQANLRYIRAAMDEPMLEKEHELELARLWKENNDEKALHELVRSYTRLVVAIASKFKNYGLPIGDLIQAVFGYAGRRRAALLPGKGGKKTIKAKNIVIATGSESTPLNGIEVDEKQIVTYKNQKTSK